MAEHRFSAAGLSARVSTGLALAALLLVVWHLGGLALFGLVTVVSALAQWEFYSLFMPTSADRAAKILGLVLGVLLLGLAWFAPACPPTLPLTGGVLILAVHSLAGWRREIASARLLRGGVLLAGLLYIPLLLAPTLGFSPAEQMLVVVTPALSDVVAYFVGVRFGAHRIWPAVSPKKSVEGAIGGLLAAMAGCGAIGAAAGQASLPAFALLGLELGILAQLGDFFESSLKRAVDIKDSGKLLPGHGGMLDRIDSILFASGAYAVTAACVPFFG